MLILTSKREESGRKQKKGLSLLVHHDIGKLRSFTLHLRAHSHCKLVDLVVCTSMVGNRVYLGDQHSNFGSFEKVNTAHTHAGLIGLVEKSSRNIYKLPLYKK